MPKRGRTRPHEGAVKGLLAAGFPELSVSLELGLFLGAKAFSAEDKQRDKRCLILDVEPYRYQKFISDIAGQDI